MTILPKALKFHRERFPMSQDALATASGVSKKTIARLETGKTSSPNANTAQRLASALKVRPEELGQEPREGEGDRERAIRKYGLRPIKGLVDGDTALAFQMVESQYGIPVSSQIKMAPLFAAILAEGSLAWRREKLAAVEEAASQLHSLGGGHLSFAYAAYRALDACPDEKASIEKRDLFGKDISEDNFNLGFDPSEHNPFADYLRECVSKFNPAAIEFDREGSELKTPEGIPEYRIWGGLLDEITGGDEWAEYALKRGHTRIRDIPEGLLSEDAKTERIAWLAAKIPTEDRAEHEKYLAELADLLGNIELSSMKGEDHAS